MPYHYFKELLWLTVFSLTHGMCICLFLFRLHMISEIEEFFHVLVDFPESKDNNTSDVIMLPSASDLLNNWQARIQMAQVWYMFSQDLVAKTSLCICTCAGYTSANTATGMWSDKIWHILWEVTIAFAGFTWDWVNPIFIFLSKKFPPTLNQITELVSKCAYLCCVSSASSQCW